ncbi:MAG: ATP-dependent DNA helicase RecG [Azospirillum sp.]|nr:ATP-dependent DNA helicase RecG [Azospirillum sp.]
MSQRPALLYPLFAPLASIKGLGPRLAKLAEKLVGPHVVGLLWHLPSGVIDRRFAPKIAEAPSGQVATLTVRVDGHAPPVLSGRPYKVRCTDETGVLDLVFFRVKGDYLTRLLPIGQTVVVSGKVEHFHDQPQISHPDHIGPAEARGDLETVEPVYPLTAGLPPKTLRRAIRSALDLAPELPEWQDPAWLAARRWPAWRAALETVHAPEDDTMLGPATPERQRLAFDELLANQLALALVRQHQRRLAGRALAGDGRLRRPVRAALPFALTAAQEQALREINADMAEPRRMLRLLQGDVGSGKTVVALLAMLSAIEAGTQAALMAPTEILARQHLETLSSLAAPAGLRIALLTGRDKGKGRTETLARLAAGEIDLLVGTHAIFQEEVAFRDLGLAVIDEQHRFGVHQRLLLSAKGRATDVLVMTATPIPRTLTLTAYGDMEVSRLTERPPGRKPVDTRTIALDRLDEVIGGVARKIAEGARVYWVCPLVEESEVVDLAAATERQALLKARLGERVGLIHGRMKGADKDRVMAAFAEGGLDVLVATTVIEVGVHVPAASVMVVEHAERFGLAQLHQLRGRIGRGAAASTCLLLYEGPLGEVARSRLRILRDTEDGFLIAEEDLRLRGAGEVLGTRQSGLPGFRLADLAEHAELLEAARDDARLITERDPDLKTDRGQALRSLLYLFERDAAVRYLRSG